MLVARRPNGRPGDQLGEDRVQLLTRRGAEWLSTAADRPHECREIWEMDPRKPVALPAGRLFDVVVVNQQLGVETFDQLVRRQLPVGPVEIDRAAKKVGFFLPPDSREWFRRQVTCETTSPPEYRYLGRESMVVVPGRLSLSEDRYAWLSAPFRQLDANPARAVALALMLVASAELLARAEQYGEERIWVLERVVHHAERG
ncbi:bifunctional DNA primase/polymerase [Streptomyces orinoci]|uniref:Bifunctional DNA primase/polymerase n=1 Tax=Streptomyces orinoci TaxID=67339 RepID=A0ABV3JV92_STRON|nr:bifunctional DNA primase/polymerase [Streptomyces orinoci]